jgi:predicted enzyme related to lactoylglutathione lyase
MSRDQDMGPAGVYTMFLNGDRMAGGMMTIGPDWGPVPSHWAVYFAVSDCDASVAKATRDGAEVRVPPRDIPEIGRFSVLMDPQGASFAIIKLLNPQPNLIPREAGDWRHRTSVLGPPPSFDGHSVRKETMGAAIAALRAGR